MIRILHTNDIHSNFKCFSKIAEAISKKKDLNTLVLDAGDFADFKDVGLQGTNGRKACDLLKEAGYDAWTIGNNEMFAGKKVLEEMISYSEVPMLSANLRNLDGSRIKDLKDSIIVEKNLNKFLIIGLSPNLGEFLELDGFSIIDNEEAIKNVLEENKGNFDYCILLTHIGRSFDNKLCENIKEIDLIIGGHSHNLDDSIIICNDTPMHMAGEFGQNLGEVLFDINDKTKSIGSQIKSDKYTENREINRIIEKDNLEAYKNLSKTIAKLDIDLWHDVIEENPMTNFIADALCKYTNSKISIINSGIVNGGLKKGNISMKKLIEICPSPLNVTCFDIMVKDLLEAIENSLLSEVCLKDGRGPGFRGKYVGRIHFSGLILSSENSKCILLDKNQNKLNENAFIRVASSDYLQRGSGYISMRNNKNVKYYKPYIRHLISMYIEDKEILGKSYLSRVDM